MHEQERVQFWKTKTDINEHNKQCMSSEIVFKTIVQNYINNDQSDKEIVNTRDT